MNPAYLITGGNLGDREENLALALQLIEQRVGGIVNASSVYETVAWGVKDQPDYLNQVLQIETSLPPEELLSALLRIEQDLGRIRQFKYGPRLIDIDILFYADQVIQQPALIIPHPQIQYRRFVLQPLCEIAPNLVHPVLNERIATLLENCRDTLNVKKFCDTNALKQVDL